MGELKLYSVSDRYVDFLRNDPKLIHVFDNKENDRKHTRKYLGAVLKINDILYYIPFASPKKNDYYIDDNGSHIRKSTPTIIRMTDFDDGNTILLGTLKISNMIPVPLSELSLYDVSHENDIMYKNLVQKELRYIRKNANVILNNAKLVYRQKCFEEENGFTENCPNYLKSVIPFKYAEGKYMEYCAPDK